MGVLESIIGWLAPPVCLGCGSEGLTICLGCSEAMIIPFGECCFKCNALSAKARTCPKCRSNGPPSRVWVTTDYEATAKELIQIYKFDHQRAAVVPISQLMSETFASFNSEEEILKANYLIVPVPTATSRVRERGFDHSKLLARALSHKLKIQNKNPLMRLGQSRQVGLSRVERMKQAHGKYVVVKPQLVAGRNILLIDDVVTTGATLSSCSKALRAAGALRVDALVFAKKL